jgi:hypothetical protein
MENVPEDLERRARQVRLSMYPILSDLIALYGVEAALNALLNLYVQVGLRAVGEQKLRLRVAEQLPELIAEHPAETPRVSASTIVSNKVWTIRDFLSRDELADRDKWRFVIEQLEDLLPQLEDR